MATKITKKAPVSNESALKDPVVRSPFAEIAAEEAAENRVPRTPRVFKVGKPAPKIEAAVEAAPAKHSRKPKTVLAADPFAELAGTSPVKKLKKKSTAAASEIEKPSTPATKKARTVTPNKVVVTKKVPAIDVTRETVPPPAQVSPIFKALADVTLPVLKKEDRARLLLQSPTRAYFYWSVRRDPGYQLRAMFGDASNNFTLVVKLRNLSTGGEDLYPAEREGGRWFDVEPGKKYEAEIGFYATSRPYFRILYSNTIETPRRTPSPNPASDARWTLSANKFAEVLDVSGFTSDAVDVAIAGDDVQAAADATHIAFSRFVGGGDFTRHSPEDLRYALVSLAAGVTLANLRHRLREPIFAALSASRKPVSTERSRAALKEHFNIDEAEWAEEEFGAAVHGASLLHFPKTLTPRKMTSTFSPRYEPVGSHSVR